MPTELQITEPELDSAHAGHILAHLFKGKERSLANHQSAIKRARQSEIRRMRNKIRKSVMRSSVKRVDAAIAAGDKTLAETELKEAISVIDRTGQRGVIHKRQASRRVARLVARVKAAA